MIKRFLFPTIVVFALFTVSCDKKAPTGTFTVDKTEANVGDVLNVTLTAEDNKKIDAYDVDLFIKNTNGQTLETIHVFLDGSVKTVNESYQYTIPAVTGSGDSITTGFVLMFEGDVWDRRSNGYHVEETVTIL